MDPIAIFFLLIVLGCIILFVTRPFFERRRVRLAEDSHELSSLLAERERLLTSLQELDFDNSLGKIPAEDYPVQRAALLQKGSEILRQLDALTPSLEGQIGKKEKRIKKVFESSTPVSDEDLEELLSKRRNTLKEKTAGFCPKCGKPVLKSDIFCPSCGNTLK